MNYQLLRRGDRYPAVGVMQKLLNRTGANIDVDGEFGLQTEAAVKAFQKQRKLSVDGIVGEETWPRLVSNERLPIFDCVDVFDPDLQDSEAIDIRRAGGNPLVLGGMCNGVAQAVSLISSQARNVFILRFHGHGASGLAGISAGTGSLGLNQRNVIASGNWAKIEPDMAKLRGVFGPYGCVQFMHCETGRGVEGARLLQLIADKWGVPVTAAINIQYGGGTSTFIYEGPTRTAFPGGGSLRQWCMGLPNFAMASVA